MNMLDLCCVTGFSTGSEAAAADQPEQSCLQKSAGP